MKPEVSVVIPVYNVENYLRLCLDSLINQSLREIEIICVDDGSTDSSPEILREYAARDARIQIISQKNGGPGNARNHGLSIARGNYTAFLDADDWFERDMIMAMLNTARKTKSDITICRAERFDDLTGQALDSAWMLKERYLPGLVFSPGEIAEHLFQFTYGMVWDKLYSTLFLKNKGLVFPALCCAEDTAFVYKSLLVAERIAVLPEVKVHYRVNRRSSVSNSFVRQPGAPFKAFGYVKEYLDVLDGGEKYRQSFLNWAMEYLVWQACNMPDKKIRRQYYEQLHCKWFPELGLETYPIAYYEDRKVYLKFLLTKFLPFSLFSALVDVYKRMR